MSNKDTIIIITLTEMKNQEIFFVLNQKQQEQQLIKEVGQKKRQDQNFLKLNKGFESIKCSSLNPCRMFCYNSKCQQEKGILCDKTQCQCYKKHQNCQLLLSRPIFTNLKNKITFTVDVQKQFNETFDKAFGELSRIRDKAFDEFRLYGLKANQIKFWTSIQKGETKSINAKLVGPMLRNMKIQFTLKDANDYFNQLKQIIQQVPKHFQAKFKRLSSKKFQPISNSFISQSQLIVTSQQENIIRNFFSEPIVQCSLLYRASQNQFSTQRFFKKCCGIQSTLLIAETQFGKKIGGFANPAWQFSKNEKDNQITRDPSNKSFIFSLTNNDKFKLQKSQNALSYWTGSGPRFGTDEYSDLQINDKSNDYVSSSQMGKYYINQKYKYNDQQSYKLFSGSQSDAFKVKQWEVFRLLFKPIEKSTK